MPLALDNLWQKVIEAVHPTVSSPHYPIYAENRRTHAPEVIEKPTAHSATGQEFPNQPLSGAARARLGLAGLQNNVGMDMTNFLTTQSGHQGAGSITVTPTTKSSTQNDTVLRHETVHSVLDNNGIGKPELQKFMSDNPQLAPVQHAFDSSPADGDAALELPAYMAQPAGPYYIPDPTHRAAYLQAFVPWLRSQSPKAADQYESLMSQ